MDSGMDRPVTMRHMTEYIQCGILASGVTTGLALLAVLMAWLTRDDVVDQDGPCSCDPDNSDAVIVAVFSVMLTVCAWGALATVRFRAASLGFCACAEPRM